MSPSTSGVDMMNQINLGELKYQQSNIALEVKKEVSSAMEEIITIGARVRPLKLSGKRVGWIRPLASSERKILDRMIEDNDERIVLILTHCTTFSEDEINNLDIYEINSILHRLYSANVADISLFPYISAFCSTQTSQLLWESKYDHMFEQKSILLPDGKEMKLFAPSSHLNLWALLTSIRNRSIMRLEESLNLSAIVRAHVGKNADKYVKELIRELNSLKMDQIEPWTEIVDYVKLQSDAPHFDDGFGHSHEDNTVQGLLREMDGMIHGDKHEQLMQQFYNKQVSEAQEKERELQIRVQKRRIELATLEDSNTLVVVTDAEVKRREREIRARSQGLVQQSITELANQSDEMPSSSERITKYFEREG